MPASKRRPAAPRCDLGVTGKRVRRALPPIAPSPAFRAELGDAINRRIAASGGAARPLLDDDTQRKHNGTV